MGCLGALGLLLAMALLLFATKWVGSLLGHPLGLTPTYHDLGHRGHGWLDAHYQHILSSYVATLIIEAVLAITVLLAIAWLIEPDRLRARFTVRGALVVVALLTAAKIAPLGARAHHAAFPLSRLGGLLVLVWLWSWAWARTDRIGGQQAGQADRNGAAGEVADGRRWLDAIHMTCPACGHEAESPGGLGRCPECGKAIPDDAQVPAGWRVLERT